MKRFPFFFLMVQAIGFPLIAQYSVNDAQEITYERLVGGDSDAGGHDFIAVFRKLFEQFKVKTLFEFGMGFPTKYFLDSCNKVISVEFVTHGYGPGNYQKFLHLYRDYANWIPVVYFSGFQGDPSFAPYKYIGSESVYKAASYQCATHNDYALIDDFYLIELNAFIRNFVRFHKIDAAFVNSAGVYNRGDLVQLLFGKTPVIIATDTHVRADHIPNDLYGFSRLQTPDDYEEIYIPTPRGTTFWIVKREGYEQLKQEVKEYAQGF